MTTHIPSLFVSHGAPTLFLEAQPTRTFLTELGRSLPRPKAVLCVSAHWATETPTVTLAQSPGAIHDFYGFPEELFRVRYPAPGSPEVAHRALDLLNQAGISAMVDAARGLDHGAWVPLGLMYPQADVPVVQLSVQPGMAAEEHLAVGRALAVLSREGVLVMGSGGATHNLADLRWNGAAGQPPEYVASFDAWLKSAVLAGRTQELTDYLETAPYAARNHPTSEHLLPLFAPLGVGGTPKLLHQEFTFGVLSMAAFLWQNPPD